MRIEEYPDAIALASSQCLGLEARIEREQKRKLVEVLKIEDQVIAMGLESDFSRANARAGLQSRSSSYAACVEELLDLREELAESKVKLQRLEQSFEVAKLKAQAAIAKVDI